MLFFSSGDRDLGPKLLVLKANADQITVKMVLRSKKTVASRRQSINHVKIRTNQSAPAHGSRMEQSRFGGPAWVCGRLDGNLGSVVFNFRSFKRTTVGFQKA